MLDRRNHLITRHTRCNDATYGVTEVHAATLWFAIAWLAYSEWLRSWKTVNTHFLNGLPVLMILPEYRIPLNKQNQEDNMNCFYVYSATYKRDPISVELHVAGFFTGNKLYMNDRFWLHSMFVREVTNFYWLFAQTSMPLLWRLRERFLLIGVQLSIYCVSSFSSSTENHSHNECGLHRGHRGMHHTKCHTLVYDSCECMAKSIHIKLRQISLLLPTLLNV